MAEKKALFINLQSGAVQVFDEGHKAKSIQPWSNRTRKSFGGVYIVAGEHYRQFVSKMGPLQPLPPGEKFNPALLPEGTEAPVAPKEEKKKAAPITLDADKSEDPATGRTEGFPDGTADEGSNEMESGGGEEAGADAGVEDFPPSKPSSGKVKIKGKGKGKKS